MQLNTSSSPHIHSGSDVSQLMQQVMLALLPGIALYVWFFGWGVVVNILLAMGTALALEAAMLKLRDRPLAPFLGDRSALLTAMLLGVALPPLAPWWITGVGVFFAIVFAKHLYGGLGFNPFNPAMVGYVVLLISFPQQMTQWLPPQSISGESIGFGEALSVIFGGALSSGVLPDAISMATPLDHLKIQLDQAQSVAEITTTSPLFGRFGGLGWEWISLAFLAGGLWLIYRKAIHWHIPVSMLGSLLLIATLFYLIDPQQFASPLFHLLSGAAIVGAFFIATDPVTASTTPRGRLIYGACIGVLIYIIRTWGSYPDGVAFAVLLMNMVAPTLDYYTQPRVFGRGKN